VEANELAKIADGDRIWHRMGDVGWLDDQGRFWYCGRMAHRVKTAGGTLFSVPCESIFNTHPRVFRTALVGLGDVPVIVVEPLPGQMPRRRAAEHAFTAELKEIGSRQPITRGIEHFLFHPSLPVDIRHNAKIFREKLVGWAASKLSIFIDINQED
jgi:acyl-coenzyme A synthetase/AMP-(fatty) acid ligase